MASYSSVNGPTITTWGRGPRGGQLWRARRGGDDDRDVVEFETRERNADMVILFKLADLHFARLDRRLSGGHHAATT